MKIEIEISDVLQFRLVVLILEDSAQHSDVFLITSCVRKRRALDALGLAHPNSRFLESPINPLSRALASAALAYYVY